ncbi:alpha/beta fold hydrolase [Muricauda oceani]|uniref:Alpha/beta fold hydrolase n=1 Tax=Flagellimonas oceani TaxID=2698672 RepID=A0A6G7J6S4_9FLAO|nr:alpha/beta fold hydrolase [Allomuricauda oceani]MBW8242371.1 alpha/beta fold hydrolase [Allomuricauda oceani]QII46127.1 alpha/beta fold hydrolase [Allomuricauda oceani]
MPQLTSNYLPPFLFRSGHFATIYSGIVRSVNGVVQKRERMVLSDGDFLDLDWSDSPTPTQKLVILLHGLEGDALRPYITGSAKILNQNGYDTCAVNYRGCSGEPNITYRSYHSGATEDLIEVVDHILNTRNYTEIYLKGFSLGGNLLLKYLGEGNNVPKQLKGAVAVSVPCNLHDSCKQLLSPKNILYAIRFKGNLLEKLRQKQQLFPNKITDSDIKKIKTLKDFDDIYTSRAHGFKDALDYYQKSSSLQFLPTIQVPSLIINAKNDSFLGKECYPFTATENNPSLYLETPTFGGHVGFWGKNNITYTEKRALDFFDSL